MARISKGLDAPKEFENENLQEWEHLIKPRNQSSPATIAASKKLTWKDYLLGLIGLVFSLIALGVIVGIVWKIAKWIAL